MLKNASLAFQLATLIAFTSLSIVGAESVDNTAQESTKNYHRAESNIDEGSLISLCSSACLTGIALSIGCFEYCYHNLDAGLAIPCCIVSGFAVAITTGGLIGTTVNNYSLMEKTSTKKNKHSEILETINAAYLIFNEHKEKIEKAKEVLIDHLQTYTDKKSIHTLTVSKVARLLTRVVEAGYLLKPEFIGLAGYPSSFGRWKDLSIKQMMTSFDIEGDDLTRFEETLTNDKMTFDNFIKQARLTKDNLNS